MQITSFNPLILTEHAEEIIATFEALGFERQHGKEGETFASVSMKDANGFHVDVTQVANMPKDMTTIRMSVRDFQETYDFLIAHGFKNVQGDKITDTGSSVATMLVSPSGFSISLSHHIRKDEE